ncbi:MAG: collagen-like protein [Clostridia bacterium]|nr:collagen-like protein [Clostridia bacterium]
MIVFYHNYFNNQIILRGPTGPQGAQGLIGPTGSTRLTGDIGPTGATGTSDIIEMSIINTTLVNSILIIRNLARNTAALTITPLAGGTRPVSVHLVITQIQ